MAVLFTAMFKTTELSAALAFRTDGNEIISGGGADASSGSNGGGSSTSKGKTAQCKSRNSGRNLVNLGLSKFLLKHQSSNIFI